MIHFFTVRNRFLLILLTVIFFLSEITFVLVKIRIISKYSEYHVRVKRKAVNSAALPYLIMNIYGWL